MVRSRRLLLVTVALIAASGAVPAVHVAAQSPATARPMGIVDLLNVPRLADPQLSPDGREVIYTLGEADWKSGRRISHVWRVWTRPEVSSSRAPSQT